MTTDITQETPRRCPSIREWHPADRVPPLATGELHLWRLPTRGAGDEPDVLALLSPRERERAATIRNASLRSTFIHGRGAKRRVLGSYLGLAPAAVPLEAGPKGKPYLPAPHTGLHFNLTHSDQLILLAVSRDGPIGLDAECIRPRHGLMGIARRMFGSKTVRRLETLPEDQQLELFHRHWTHLEAGVKALGSGLFEPEARAINGMDYACFVPMAGFLACIAAPFPLPAYEAWHTLAFAMPIWG